MDFAIASRELEHRAHYSAQKATRAQIDRPNCEWEIFTLAAVRDRTFTRVSRVVWEIFTKRS